MLSIHDLHDFTVFFFTRVTITRLVTSRRSLEITYNNSFDNTIIRSNKIIIRLVRHKNLEYQPKRAIPSIENVFAFFERGYIVHYKTK